MESKRQPDEVVPYGSAYGLDNRLAQEKLQTAAIVMLDHAMLAFAEFATAWEIRDLAENHADATVRQMLRRLRVIESEAELPYVTEELPAIYNERYRNFDFLKNWVVTVAIVGWKLAQAERHMLSNVAEELAMDHIIKEALSGVELSEADAEAQEAASEALRDLYDSAYEDNDFEALYDLQDSDDIADLDPERVMGMTDLRFKNWFVPFGSGVDRGVPHPFLLDT